VNARGDCDLQPFRDQRAGISGVGVLKAVGTTEAATIGVETCILWAYDMRHELYAVGFTYRRKISMRNTKHHRRSVYSTWDCEMRVM
jgi:hypothetical protein